MKTRKNPHLRGFDYKGSSWVYFITLCSANRMPRFLDTNLAELVQRDIEFRRSSKQARVFCSCIMPDHVHMVLSLSEGFEGNLQTWISSFKRSTSRAAKQRFSVERLWQKNFYDHVVRKEESLARIVEYVLNNPVRKGIVERWEGYPYSRVMDPLPL